MFVTVQHKHSNRPFDSMNIWLEEVEADGFVVCLREFMSFDGIHTGLKVVSFKKFSPVLDYYIFLCPTDQGAGFFHRAAFQPSQNIPPAGHVQAF